MTDPISINQGNNNQARRNLPNKVLINQIGFIHSVYDANQALFIITYDLISSISASPAQNC